MGSGGVIIIWILVFFGIFYFLAIRPQRRQRQAHSEMVQTLKKGDEVVTIGGMFGTVTRIADDRVEIEIAKRTRVWYLKRAISSITAADEDEDEYIENEDDEEQAQLTEGDEAGYEAEVDEAEVDEHAPEEPEAPEPPKA
jgi:preprotein translocase subunit YajC